MIPVSLLLALLTAPALEVSIAPDQPVPYVYSDEPVILQIKSNEDGKATGQVSVAGNDGKSVAVAVAEVPLRANGAHWQPLEGVPAAKGRFRVHVTLNSGDAKVETDLVYCRIDRPGEDARTPVRVRIDAPEPNALHALRGIPLREITLPVSAPDIQTLVGSATDAGFHVTLAIDAASAADVASLGKLAAALGDSVSAWRVAVPEIAVDALEPLGTALHDAGSRAHIEVALGPNNTDLATYLAAGLGHNAFKSFVTPKNDVRGGLDVARRAFEEAGYEGPRLQAIVHSAQEGDGDDQQIAVVREILECQMVDGASPEVAVSEIYANGTLGESYTMLSAMAHRLDGYEYFDDLPMMNRARTVIFRKGSDWIAAMWATGQPAIQMLPVGDAKDVSMTDANNNAVALPKYEERSLRMALTNSPVYVSGKGGTLLAVAARGSARSEADRFVKNKAFQTNLPPEAIELIKPIAVPGFARVDRVSFFALLRLFPLLEQKWHEGTMPRAVAVPAMASLSRIVRSLCVIEQDSGEPFIELLNDTFARSGDYQSQYLTSTGGSVERHERADWLLSEVARLTAEAKGLAERDRGIEAVGVASMAEWRARSLEFARNAAPLGLSEPAHVVETPPAKAQKPSPQKPAKQKPAKPKSKNSA